MVEDTLEQGFDAVVIGAGLAGSVIARELAERGGQRVLVVERRNHIGGAAYDEPGEGGILYHPHGPHIFHSTSERAFMYLSRFTEWSGYQHRVLANVHGTFLPVPFNKRSVALAFGQARAATIVEKLVEAYGEGARVPITTLREADDPDLSELADYVYENVFLHYTTKQWGVSPDEVDPAVTARVPVLVSDDDRYFQDPYQGMPLDGYTPLFARMLEHPGIEVRLRTDATDVLGLVDEAGADATADPAAGLPVRATLLGQPFSGSVIYTGAVDELLCRRFGALPYRSLRFEHQLLEQDRFQPAATVNYTVSEDFTRITEWKQLTGQLVSGRTLITREYPQAYVPDCGMTPYYAVASGESARLYDRYASALAGVPGLHLLGRLAEYRYYNMDAVVDRALELADLMLED